MHKGNRIGVVIPALNEERSIGNVLDGIPAWVDQIVVVDNGSTDATSDVARDHGADVVLQPERGYGAACLRGIESLQPCDIVVFLDADFSDYPNQMHRLVDPIAGEEADLVIGSRRLGNTQPGALTPQQRFGNALACALIRLFWRVRYTDLGPFRAIRYPSLQALDMRDRTYGWTVEMQVKAASRSLRVMDVPVDYRRRIGTSKISGTVRGVVAAGTKILSTIFRAAAGEVIGVRRKHPRRRVIVFTRYPEPGVAKTRMAPALGNEGAADLQRIMTEHCLRNSRSMMGAEIEVRYLGGELDQMQQWLGAGLRYTEQNGGDLGARMRRAFEAAFAEGVAQAVIIGTDCPDLSPAVLQSAFDALARGELTLGPATDGGYYLIGLHARGARRALSHLFNGVEWGTERVYTQTAERAVRHKIRLTPLVPLHDIDRPEDLAVWERTRPGAHRPPLSVIIPVLNEEQALPKTLQSLMHAPGVEVIVVDGGSTDNTAEVAAEAGARVLHASPGRAHQMNVGAAWAAGEAFLFLHGDTVLKEGYDREIEHILSANRVALGAFRFTVDDPGFSMRVITFFTNFRARWLRAPYGDQGFFLKRDTFRGLGGFSELPIMEDYVFVRRVARAGRVRISRLPAQTSARRWRRLGPWRTVIYNQLIIAGYWAGVNPRKLAAFYQRPKSPRKP